MTQEKLMIEKTYYETFLTGNEKENPVNVLGNAYFEEQKNEIYDLSHIRFAQGEIYFHCKDYETAIFKWENINNELEPWAKKNIADAYYELGLLSSAEDVYTSIQADDKILNVEVALQLISLYIERNKLELAYGEIEKAISIDPDYPNVTSMAKTFYEEHEDWDKAVELAVKEAIRTESLQWFATLNSYIDREYTGNFAPGYFYSLLISAYRVDRNHFKGITSSLWNSYQYRENYLEWIRTVNNIFLNIEVELYDAWQEISTLYQNTYYELMEGPYLVKDLQNVMPDLLVNWFKTTNAPKALPVTAAVLAWSDLFPSTIDTEIVYEAEELLTQVRGKEVSLEESLQFFNQIIRWAESNKLEVGYKLKWLIDQIAHSNQKHLVIAGAVGSGKSSFINSILEENVLESTTSTLSFLQHDDHIEMNEIWEGGKRTWNERSEQHEAMASGAYIEWKLPSNLLNNLGCRFIDTPGLSGSSLRLKETFEYFPLADGIFYVIDANTSLPDHEAEILAEMRDYVSDLPVHFLLNKMDEVDNEYDAEAILKDIQEKIDILYPGAKVFPYSSVKAVSLQQDDLASFIQSEYRVNGRKGEGERSAQILYVVRQTLTKLLNKRVAMEKGLKNSIEKNEDILNRLSGFMNSLGDLEKDKARAISKSYREVVAQMKAEMVEEVPNRLRECSSLISEESDFRQVHIELNEKMNEKIQDYLRIDLLPKMNKHLLDWVTSTNGELTETQTYLDEMCATFNDLFEGDRLSLPCDFKVVEDWQRDISRMTGRSQIEKENIMMRLKPAQFLLKSAGKLLGVLPQNKSILSNQYKKYLENESFEDVTRSITNKFFLQFEMFERALEQDVVILFKEPRSNLAETVNEVQAEIETSQESLAEMKSNPEAYYDPLTLFEVRLLQYEFMKKAGGSGTISYSR
ncbi:dynamin family protein [Rossellomorea sp. BNER]|uniref:dynamin family protein n=1 Tax=Rossellomorea sp. BNER TaxID=2962031 RepID=UPI003AF2860E|nr:dynamin family protein [Rossellomorea sp. BNER]